MFERPHQRQQCRMRQWQPLVRIRDIHGIAGESLEPRQRFFDHWGRTMTRGGYVVVAEPYFTAMTEEQWEDVRRFAIKYDLKYMVVPNSYHFPGQTLRIVFWHEDWCLDAMPVAAVSSGQDC